MKKITQLIIGLILPLISYSQTYTVTSGASANSWYNPGISNIGTILFSQGADDTTATIPLSFNVPYFGG